MTRKTQSVRAGSKVDQLSKPALSISRSWEFSSLMALSCLIVTPNAAHASFGNGMPPVVVHPTNGASTPINTHSTTTAHTNQTNPILGQQNTTNSGGQSKGQHNVVINQSVNGGAANSSSAAIQHSQNSANGTTSNSTLPSAGYKLDLSSTNAIIVLGSSLFGQNQSITINVGGSNQTFTAGQKVTAAEYVAIQEQSGGHGQTLVLNGQGAADGGKFTLNSSVNNNVTEVVVPSSVTAVDYFSKNNSLTVAGDLVNYGSIYGVSTSSHVTAGSISANEITNANGGTISTALPNSLLSSIPNAVANVELTLISAGNITNSGTISSAGGLTLATASGGIANNSTGIISAANNVNLNAGNGNVTNFGLVSSKTGNINIASPDKIDINVNAQGGTFQALSGDINVRNASYTGGNNITLAGGNYLSKNLSLYSGNGDIEVNAQLVSGNLNSNAQVEHVEVAGGVLNLGNNTVNGDPTFAQVTGAINISGANNFTQNVVILASGDITASNNGTIVDPGFDVTLVAGLGVATTGSQTITVSGNGVGQSIGSGFDATIDFTVKDGGNINFSGDSAGTIISTAGTGVNSPGGNVILVASPNAAGSSFGTIIFPATSTSIDTHANGFASGGHVDVYAGNSTVNLTAITLGNIVTSGSNSGGVLIETGPATSNFTNGSGHPTITWDNNGSLITGAIVPGGTILPNAVSVNTIITSGVGGAGATVSPAASAIAGGNGGIVSIHAGAGITVASIQAFGGGGGGAAGTSGEGANGGSGGPINLTADTGNITVTTSINSSGGGGGAYYNVATTGGSAGSVSIIATKGNISVTDGVFAVDGAGGGQTGNPLFGGGGGGGASFGGGGGGGGAGDGSAGGGGGGGVLVGGGGGGADQFGGVGGGGTGGGFNGSTGGTGTGFGGTPGTNTGVGGDGTQSTGGGGAPTLGGAGYGGNAPSGVDMGSAGSTTAPNAAGPNASITLTAATGSGTSLTAGSGQELILNANGASGAAGGSVVFNTSSTNLLTVDSSAYNLNINAMGSSSGGNGGLFSLTTAGSLKVNASAINVAPQMAGFKGGSTILDATVISNINIGAPLILNNSGSGGGGGGVLWLIQSTVVKQTIGTGSGNIELYANGGLSGGNGGVIIFSAGGSIVANAAQLGFAPQASGGSGGEIVLSAGNNAAGTLLVNGSLNANGLGTGIGGIINLQSNSTTTFSIGANTTNGVTGTLSSGATNATNDGTITVTNLGGGVANFVPINTANTLTLTSGKAGGVIVGSQLAAPAGSITLDAAGTGNIGYNTQAVSIFAGGTTGSITLSAPGGTIGGATTPLSIDTATTNVNASGGVVNVTNAYAGGQALNSTAASLTGPLTYAGMGNVTINGVSSANFTVNNNITITTTSGGNIILGGSLVSSAGSISLTTSGAGTFSDIGTAVPTATTLNLTNTANIGAILSPFNTNVSNLSVVSSGFVDIANQAAGGLTLTDSTTKNGFILFSNGNLTISTAGLTASDGIGLTTTGNNGSIIFNDLIGNATAAVALSANGSGLIRQTNAQGYVVQASSLNLSGASGGIFLGFNSPSVTASGTGIVSLGNFNFGSSAVNASSAATSFSLGANGSLTLGNITANNGFVNILAAGALMQVNSGSTITANNNFILLREADTTAGQIVVLGGSTTLHTTGTGGAVDIIIGTTLPAPVAGLKPANLTVNTTSGTAYYGTNSIDVPNAPATLNLKGSNIQFSTGTLPATAIVLGPGVVITADPIGVTGVPVVSPATSSVMSTQSTAMPAVLLQSVNGQVVAPLSSDATNATSALHSALITAPILSSNAGLVGAVSSPMITALTGSAGGNNVATAANASGTNPGTVSATGGLNSTNAAVSSVNSNANSISSMAAVLNSTDGTWISDTELVTGKIPATLFSDQDFGIKPDVSTVIKMDDEEDAALPVPTTTEQLGTPLTGSVSHNAGGVKGLNLQRGSVVFAPTLDTVVNTPFGSVKIGAQSVVLMMSFRHGLAIYDLHDSRLKSVVVKAGNHELVLSPGMHTMITNESIEKFEQVNPAQLIGHRNIRERALGQGLKAFVSQFSVIQAISAVTPLKQLVNSNNTSAQKVTGQMLKTAAIIQQMSPGDYEQLIRPIPTAYQGAVDSTVFGSGR